MTKKLKKSSAFLNKNKLTLLRFVEKSDHILREIMPEVDFKDPLLKKNIKDMCFSILPKQLKKAKALYSSAAGMAANQWGIKKRIFIFTPHGSDDDNKKMEVMINPSYIPFLRPSETEFSLKVAYEGCFSIPLTVGLINRYDAIKATYYTENEEKIERIMEGWEARVFQHETDHLNGKLFDGRLDNYAGPDCLKRLIFNDLKEMDQFWEETVKPSRIED